MTLSNPPPESLGFIDSLDGRASAKTCSSKGGYDFRRYSEALAESGFPSIYNWCSGKWDKTGVKEFQQFVLTAIQHGSFPMLAVVGIIATDSPHIFKAVHQRLGQNLQRKLNSLINIGSGIDYLGLFIQEVNVIIAPTPVNNPEIQKSRT